MKLRWILCLLISLAIHVALLNSDQLGGKLKIQTAAHACVGVELR